MAFYIKPPGGIEKLHNLRVFCQKRLGFLRRVLSCDGSVAFRQLLAGADTADESECLIEGSSKDRVSHFLLRLACCQDPEMTTFLVKAETELFCYRFASMNSEELVHLLHSTHRFLLHLLHRQANRKQRPRCGGRSSRTACDDLLTILQGMMAGGLTWTDIVTRYLDGCQSEFIQVPFEYALSLVARRSVVLERGVAKVPTADILKVLAFLFERIVSDGMVDARLSVRDIATGDERMMELFRDIRQIYYQDCRGTRVEWASAGGLVASDGIDDLAARFPPCMQHLHRMLRRKHRLRHFSRIQYTLFLKEVGLPVSEAVMFWRREYSQPDCCQGGSAGCTHDWKRDGRRYIYSIRHLYGLEGSRINYRAHSCRSLQDCSLGHGEEGGCPFQHFDDFHLRAMMAQAGITLETDQMEIIDLAARGKMQTACQAFFRKSAVATLDAVVPNGGTGDERKIDRKSDDETDSDFQPCKKKKPRPDSDGPGETTYAEARSGRASARDCIDKELELTEPSGAEGVLRMTSSSAPQGNQGAHRPDPDFAEASLPNTTKESTSTKEHLLMHHKDATKNSILRISGEPSEDESQNKISEHGISKSSDTRQLMTCSQQHMSMQHQTGGSRPVSTAPLNSNGDTSSTQGRLVTILKDLHIQKPVDFYKSFAQLLGSLEELEGNK